MVIALPGDRLDYVTHLRITQPNPEAAMAKGQMRSNKEKKTPKLDKNAKKSGEAPSPFAGMHSQSQPGGKPYGKKH